MGGWGSNVLGKFLIHVLRSCSSIYGGDGLQGFFNAMQYAGDSWYLSTVRCSPQVGIIEVMC